MVHDDLKVRFDRHIGLVRVEVNPWQNIVRATQAWDAGQEQPAAATALVLTGFKTQPTVEFNGTIQTNLAKPMINEDLAYLIPQGNMKSAA